MSKKDFIALADAIKEQNKRGIWCGFGEHQLGVLADFCQSQNPRFNRARWLAYIAGECGPSGGNVRD